MNSTSTKTNQSNYWWLPFISGLILLLFGIWFLAAPLDSFKTLTIVFGIIVLISGILEIYVLLKNSDGWSKVLVYLWGGLLNVILGILLIANPQTILVIISFVIGFWLIFKGGEQIKRALHLRKINSAVWKRVLTLGIIMIVLAAVLLWHPEIIGFTIVVWTSLAFIIIGIIRMYLAYRLKDIK